MSFPIWVNGKATSVSAETSTLLALVEGLGLDETRVAAEVNGEIVEPKQWAEVLLNRGDKVELVHFVGGG